MTQTYNGSQPFNADTASRAQFIAELARVNEELARQVDINGDLASELYWRDAIVANPGLQGNMKAYMIGVSRAIQEAQARGNEARNGKIRVYRDRIAHYAGCSVDAVSSQGKTADANGLIERELVPVKDDEGFGKAVFLSLSTQAKVNPSGVAVTTVRNGGVRIPECLHCHSTEHMQIRKKITFICTNPDCANCGVEVAENEVAMVTEEQIARERERQAAMPEPTKEEIEAGKLIDWVKKHGGNIRLTSTGFPVMFLPPEITKPVYDKVLVKFKELENTIARLMAA